MDLAGLTSTLSTAPQAWGRGASQFATLGAGEGRWSFPDVTIGVVLSHQPKHAAEYAGRKRHDIPLVPGSGWIFPAGLDGWCAWDAEQSFVNVTLKAEPLHEIGLRDVSAVPVRFGALDPLVAQLAIGLHRAAGAPQLYRDSLSGALAAEIARMAGLFELPRVAADPRLERAVAYIEAHLTQDVSLDTLAGVAAMSPFHFARSFKAFKGVPPHRFVVLRRIERAKILLRTTRQSVMQVAFAVGYGDVSRFAELFKRHVGATPGAFRAAA